MSGRAGGIVELTLEKPVAGGRMLGRLDGQVVLVLGGIPGERVRARVDRAERQVLFATTADVLEPSPDRIPSAADPACGGCVYSHIAYPRQLAMKAQIVGDAFARIGRIPLERDVPVLASPETGYRMRARFHVEHGRVGFYREGSHELCDARRTGQLRDESLQAAAAVAVRLHEAGAGVRAIELTENLDASERAVHVEAARSVKRAVLAGACGAVTGISLRADTASASAGVPLVVDSLEALTDGRAKGVLGRSPESFFQANRYLLPSLVSAVLDDVPPGKVLDLYAGVGLFSAALAALGPNRVVAVEGDGPSGADLRRNARPFGSALEVHLGSVERFVAGYRGTADAVVIDPPRTGTTRPAIDGIIGVGAPRIVYVSCDPATLARDARLLLDGGYSLASLRAFDLFPKTPHVECVARFERTSTGERKKL
jgi:23S rRNA (uracil1939-C5)-methyltransferase